MLRAIIAGLIVVLSMAETVLPGVAREPQDVAPILTDEPVAPAVPPSRLTFKDACAVGKRVTIVAVGDLLFHPELEQEALTPKGAYRNFWQPVEGVLAGSDITYGNFEGTAAEGITTQLELVKDPGRDWNNRVYSAPRSQLLFNYHPSVIDDLVASHFGVVSTANTHSLDRGCIGIDRTVANLERRGLAYTGTRRQDDTDHPFSVVTSVKGLNIAWLACTYATNGFPDRHAQVLYCFEQRNDVLAEIKRLAAEPLIDAVILTPHWGLEGSPTPEQRQRDLGRDAIEAGATAVIGTHPHILQPWEMVTTRDGREGLVIYSTGNFISGQRRPEQRLGGMAVIELTKVADAAKARVTAAGYVTTWVEIAGQHRVTEAPRSMPAQYWPPGNRVAAADLPRLPRDCSGGDGAAESWNGKPALTTALLPLPGTPLAREAAEHGGRLIVANVAAQLADPQLSPYWPQVLAEIAKSIPSDDAVRRVRRNVTIAKPSPIDVPAMRHKRLTALDPLPMHASGYIAARH